MKKVFYLLASTLVVVLFINQYPGPDGNDYTNHCLANANGGGDFPYQMEIWFNDPDGDCISSEHYTIWTYPGGDTDEGNTGEIFGELDFNPFFCCDPSPPYASDGSGGGSGSGSGGGDEGGGGGGDGDCEGLTGLGYILCVFYAL